MLDSGSCHAPLRLIAHPHLERGGYHLDRFDACLGGELITTSRQPLLDGARALLARGFNPDAMLTIQLASSAADSFRPKPIREWARWTITERDRDGLAPREVAIARECRFFYPRRLTRRRRHLVAGKPLPACCRTSSQLYVGSKAAACRCRQSHGDGLNP